MTDSEALDLCARWITDLRDELACARRAIRQRDERIRMLTSEPHLYWLRGYGLDEITEMARELEAVA